MDVEPQVLLWIVLFPLAGAVINGFFGQRASRQMVALVACGTVAVSLLASVYGFVSLMQLRGDSAENVTLGYTAYEWFSITLRGESVPVQVSFALDALSGVMSLVVCGVGLLIHIYAVGYMWEDPGFARFFSYLNLFTASMLILVLGSNLPLMFVGWEGVGLCSYLLIGFWWERTDYAAAGRKAFVANRIGDLGVLIGMFVIVNAAGSFEFSQINGNLDALGASLTYNMQPLGISVATIAALFLFLGCTGKSAQIPLFVWLPDAMAGPTPVSALIHAATMVTAGVYLICRLSPVFALSPTAMAVIAVIGTLTALLAASIALVQNEIKKILAYSTVSQLGFMFAAVGCGAFAAGFFHVFTHAFFKACLFLGAGSVMHAVGAHGDADIRRLGGLSRVLKHTHWTFLISCLAIAGFPLFSGFFSKDEILVGALSVGDYFAFAPWLGTVLFVLLVVAATMTAFYMFRLYFMTFSGEYRGGPAHAPEHTQQHGEAHGEEHAEHGEPHESPPIMTVPLMVLAVGAALGGFLWVGIAHFQPWVTWLAPSLGDIGVEHQGAGVAMGLGTLAALAGIGLAYQWYARESETPARLAERAPGLYHLLLDKWRVDELYDATVLRWSRLLGWVSANFDKYVIDGLTKAVSWVIAQCGFLFTRLQNGLVHAYGAVMVAGVAVIAWWFAFPHAELTVVEPEQGPVANPVRLMAGVGPAYRYRWDFDSDGSYDTAWQSSPDVEHAFAEHEFQPGFVAYFTAASYGARPQHFELQADDVLVLDPSELGRWRQEPGSDDATPPYLAAREDGLLIRANDARVRGGIPTGNANEVRLLPGREVRIGDAILTLQGLVEVTVAVRNAFGYETTERARFSLPRAAGGQRQARLHLGGDP